jgi:hypothetical protein
VSPLNGSRERTLMKRLHREVCKRLREEHTGEATGVEPRSEGVNRI